MSHTPSVEIRVLASPTREFALMLATLYHSLRKAGSLDDFQLTVFIGAPSEDWAACAAFAEWLRPEIRSIVVDPVLFEEHGIHASAAQRIEVPTEADLTRFSQMNP